MKELKYNLDYNKYFGKLFYQNLREIILLHTLKNIKKLKNEEHIMLKETKDNNIFNKKKRYQSALSDKVILKKLKKEIDNQQNNRNF